MEPGPPDVTMTYHSGRSASATFETFAQELTDGLARAGVSFEPRNGGEIHLSDSVLGTVASWEVGTEIGLRWNAMPWGSSKEASIQVRFEPEGEGSRVTWELSGWAGLFGDAPAALPDWVAGELLPAIFRHLLPQAAGDWVTDRKARRPAGAESREVYRDPTYHWPNFWLILEHLPLGPGDRLLEVGCGGGAFLRKALESGCSATGVDHSPQMVALSRETNADMVRAGRLSVVQGDAGRLPVASAEYSRCVCTGAIGFFPDPLAALREMHRALAPGGRLAVYASTKALRGTPAAPEPVASRAHFFEGPELADLARQAGFSEVQVEEPEMELYARRAGVPEEALPLFRGTGGSLLLLAKRSN